MKRRINYFVAIIAITILTIVIIFRDSIAISIAQSNAAAQVLFSSASAFGGFAVSYFFQKREEQEEDEGDLKLSIWKAQNEIKLNEVIIKEIIKIMQDHTKSVELSIDKLDEETKTVCMNLLTTISLDGIRGLLSANLNVNSQINRTDTISNLVPDIAQLYYLLSLKDNIDIKGLKDFLNKTNEIYDEIENVIKKL